MPETRAAKRQKVEEPEKKQRKRKKAPKKEEIKRREPKKAKTGAPQGASNAEEILKAFDLDTKFGACIGISRLDRWKRAKRYRLNPPETVKTLLETHSEDSVINKCLWDGRV